MSHLADKSIRTVTLLATVVRRAVRGGTGALLAACAILGACRGNSDGNTVTFRGDVDGLDTIALRGDSLLARAGRPETFFDSVPVSAPSPTDSMSAAISDSVKRAAGAARAVPFGQRAQLRGDSIARAEALRVAEAVRGGSRTLADTVRGVVTLLGAPPAKQVVLRTLKGNAIITMSGMATTGMSSLVGNDVVIRGVRISPRDIVVSDYIVRGAAGIPAFDGRITGSDETGWFLLLTDGTGRRRIASLPAPLRGLEGTRVWMAMKPGTNYPQSYGVIGRR